MNLSRLRSNESHKHGSNTGPLTLPNCCSKGEKPPLWSNDSVSLDPIKVNTQINRNIACERAVGFSMQINQT